MKTKLFFTVLLFLAVTTMLSAQNIEETQSQKTFPVTGKAYMDANDNGICDNFEKGAPNTPIYRRNCFRLNRQGQQGKGQGQGQRLRNGMGQGQGLGNGTVPARGRNRNFVDVDNNVVCDYYEASSKE